MPICAKCHEKYPAERKRLGYNTCLECGETEADKEAIRKSRCTAPLYNKGAYGYIYSKQDAHDAGK